MATTAAVSERRELEPRRAIVTVKAATSCSAHTVIGTAVATSTYVEGADASTMPSIIACSSHAHTRMAAPHAAAARPACLAAGRVRCAVIRIICCRFVGARPPPACSL